MKRCLVFVLLLLIFCASSCKNTAVNEQLKVFNDLFLSVVDTTAYKELSFRPLSPFGYNGVQKGNTLRKNLVVIISDTLIPLQNWQSSLRPYCRGTYLDSLSTLRDLKRELCTRLERNSLPEVFKFKRINNTGKYKLLNKQPSGKDDIVVVGKVQFSQVLLSTDEQSAAFVAIIYNSPKTAVEEFFIALKKENKWVVYRKERFAIW